MSDKGGYFTILKSVPMAIRYIKLVKIAADFLRVFGIFPGAA
jgi:hypothetical protein